MEEERGYHKESRAQGNLENGHGLSNSEMKAFWSEFVVLKYCGNSRTMKTVEEIECTLLGVFNQIISAYLSWYFFIHRPIITMHVMNSDSS